ncbi:MAG: PAS domain S-box protein [Bacteroidetes bacterium]|nr:PAS domain S-box protein [Bacteroidota bacterium]
MSKKKDKHSNSKINAHLGSILKTIIDGVVIINEQGIIQTTNPATSRLFGYTSNELVGKNVSILMSSPHKAKHDSYLNSYKQTGIKKIIGVGREVTGVTKKGHKFPIRLSISESVIDGTKFFTGVLHDISEIAEARAELKMVNKQLEKIVSDRTEEITQTVNRLLRANNQLKAEINLREETELELEQTLEKEKELGILKSQFVTMASHEFRTPLSTILSSASIIQRYAATGQQDKREKHIGKIKASVKNMTHILEDVLSLGRLEEGKIDNSPEVFCLADFLHQIKDQLVSIMKEDQDLDLTINPGVDEVNWDKKLIENILNNLLSNAFKYSDEGKDVRMEVTGDSDQITIRISDKGIGIPVDQQKHLFDRFFRASNALNIKGTGLGLHIVKEYLTLMSGKIEFKSAESEGSVFIITIPKNYL